VRKTSYTHNGSAWVENSDLLFVYDQWNVVLVLDANDSNAVARKCTWGLDLSGLMGRDDADGIHNAGGIGGLLAIEDVKAGGGSANSYWYFYDANGNVGQLIKASDRSLAAHYEYDPYGNTITATGPYSAANPWRFSTKWHDTELPGNVLIYYGYRYYNPRLGRWLNWDPIEELGGFNLYQAMANSATMNIDPHGKFWKAAACCLCIGSIVADIGGGAAGCAIGCLESANDNITVSECFKQCIMSYLEDRMDHSRAFNIYKSIVEGASCIACGIQLLADDKPSIPDPTDCIMVPAHGCQHGHYHWFSLHTGPPPDYKTRLKRHTSCCDQNGNKLPPRPGD
jgi:RHS repeat-associated protein